MYLQGGTMTLYKRMCNICIKWPPSYKTVTFQKELLLVGEHTCTLTTNVCDTDILALGPLNINSLPPTLCTQLLQVAMLQ